MNTFLQYLPMFARGAGMTLLVSVLGMMVAVTLGLVIALMRLYGNRYVKFLAKAYIEIYRGTPLLIQLFIIYYGLANIGISFTAFQAAVIGLGMNYAAYEAELYRAGIMSVPRGQTEAGLSLGFSLMQTVKKIILPQAFRVALPGMTNDFIALFKDSSLVSIITMVELTKTYGIIAASSFHYMELGIITALIYFGMSYPLAILARRLEKKLRKSNRLKALYD